jgi:DNA-binding PadR family transcriptional regulator
MPAQRAENKTENEFLGLKGFLSFLILHELNISPLCGDDLSKKIGKRKGSNLTPGTIYPALKRLKKRKLMSYKRFGRKKVYSLTNEGGREVEHLYLLFGNYFYGLREKVAKSPVDLERTVKKKRDLVNKL